MVEGKVHPQVYSILQWQWPNEAWSIVVDFIKHDESWSEGNIRFLVEWEPNNLLYSGSKFDLFEANKRVATGEVLSNTNNLQRGRFNISAIHNWNCCRSNLN
ncbi:hypothetical protein LY28_00173 [Ruminiclostridium sufflavum DSM 19573]|uniref:Uncharacterized protein n=1 Tax=Ruminiclostridium sufflavum DSM 19573 TaxID=1121337 RepID=A0A318YCG1_9FIRM|nr:hypothetical protein LY28_00173 [Ruminiclostridium sufflavum DSM 19573]